MAEESQLEKQYGKEAASQAMQQFQNLSEDQLNLAAQIENEMVKQLKIALASSGGVTSETKDSIFRLHQDWLKIIWPEYSLALHHDFGQEIGSGVFYEYYRQRTQSANALLLLQQVIAEHTQDN